MNVLSTDQMALVRVALMSHLQDMELIYKSAKSDIEFVENTIKLFSSDNRIQIESK